MILEGAYVAKNMRLKPQGGELRSQLCGITVTKGWIVYLT